MRLPIDIPLLGWTTDSPYTAVPQGMSLDLLNVIPNDQHQGRMRLGLRPALTLLDVIGDVEIQCLIPCSNYAQTTSSSGVYERTDRTLIVAGGKVYQMFPGSQPELVGGGSVYLNTTGRVSGVQFKEFAYLCDGTNYEKVSLNVKAAANVTVANWTNPDNDDGPDEKVKSSAGSHFARIITRFGARLALTGVETARESWFLSAIDDADDWNPDSSPDSGADAVAGGSGVEYGSIGEPITALIPFGNSGLLIAGKRSLTYLTGDPVFTGTAMHSMSRSLGLVGPNAWCGGPSQSVFVLSEEGLLFLTPNMFDVDKSAAVSGGKLDSFFQNRRWYDLDPVLVHDVSRGGVWIWLNDTSQPTRSDHLFYSYKTNGFFPIETYHPDFTGAVEAVHGAVTVGGADTVIMGSSDGVIATFDPNVICGSDGQLASAVTWSSWTDGNTASLLPAAAGPQRIESHVTMGPIAGPTPNEVLIREVTLESGLDEYLPDTASKGTTNKPRVDLIYGESPQRAVGSDVSSVSVINNEQIILTCGFSGGLSPPPPDVTLDGGTQDGLGVAATATFTFADDQNTPSGQQTITLIDTAGTSRAYVIDNDYGASGPLEFNSGATGASAADNFKALVESSVGHNGTILVSVVADAVTMTQLVGGTDGNRTIAHSSGWDALCDVNPPAAFAGGAAGPLDYCESNAAGAILGAASDDTAIDGGGASRAWDQIRWTANDLFVGEEDRRYEPVTDSGFFLIRETCPGDVAGTERWVIKYDSSGTYYNNISGGTDSNPIHYVQQPDDTGAYPLSLTNQTFHGQNSTGATATFTFGDTEFDDHDEASITLIDAGGISKTYVISNDYGASGDNPLEFNAGGSATAAAANFKIAVEHPDTHNGTILVRVVGGAVTLIQATAGVQGETAIVHSTSPNWDSICDVNPPDNFARSHPTGSEFGTFDDSSVGGQWNDVTDDSTEYVDFVQDILRTEAGVFDEVGLLDMGCLVAGRGNRRRCRIRCLTAFIRVEGVTEDNTSGYPYTLERVSVEADVVSPRNDVEVLVCTGSGVSAEPDEPDDSEPVYGACCDGSDVCTETTEEACVAAESEWHGDGTTCSGGFCAANEGLGSCCYTNDAGTVVCAYVTEGHCDQLEGTWTEDVTCANNQTCILGSCCFVSVPHPEYGWCFQATETVCTANGIPQGRITSWTEGAECPDGGPCA